MFQGNHNKSTTKTAKKKAATPAAANKGTANDGEAKNVSACPCGGGCQRCQSQAYQSAENEAEGLARQVLSTKEPMPVPASGKVESNTPSEVDVKSKDRLSILDGAGARLSGEQKAFYEPRFDADLSSVRLHTQGESAKLADEFGSKAFTYGNHIVFGGGQYSAGSARTSHILAHELAHTLQQSVGQPTVQHFDESLEGWAGGTNDDSAATVNLRYKVFNDQGQAIHNELFTSPNHRPHIALERGGSYVVQIVGNISVLRDANGPINEHNNWNIRIDWPVRVDGNGELHIRPSVPNVSGGAGDAPWSLAYGDVMGSETVGLNLALSSTESTTHTYSGSFGISEAGGVTVEGAFEPAGVGGAISGTGEFGSSQEVSRGVETATESTLTRQFGLLIDLEGTRPPVNVEVPEITIARERILPFDSNSADYSGEQFEELVRAFVALDPGDDLMEPRGTGITIEIRGYASNLGTTNANHELSQRRAEFAAEVARATLPGARILVGHVGEAMWVGVDESDDRQEHRIVEMRIVQTHEN